MDNPIRGAVYGTGLALPIWALAASFWSLTAFLVLTITGMAILITVGYRDYQ